MRAALIVLGVILLGTMMIVLAMSALCGCAAAAPVVEPGKYGLELADCTATSKTCDESIACENALRAKLGRPLRDADAGCL